MMRYLIHFASLLFLFLFTGTALLQAEETYQLDGYMGVKGGESFHYKVVLKDSSDNWMSGFAYTYKTESKAVKAELVAQIDRKGQTLHIQEQQLLSNHGFESKATICLVNAMLSRNKSEQNLSGSLITRTSNNGAACSSGSIVFIQKEQIEKLFAPPAKPAIVKKTVPSTNHFQTRSDPNQKLHAYFAQKQKAEAQQKAREQKISQPKPNPAPATATKPLVKKITEGADGIYTWHSEQIIFEIWDGGDVDNDQVTIAYNGNPILKNYQLSNQKRKLTFEIGGNELNIITITANNEGANPPNTANITLQDGEKVYSILAHNTTGKKAVIQIKKKP